MNLSLAGCVILDDRGRVLLIHRNTPKRVQWETPGGKIEEGENPNETARREAKEELGIEIEIVRELGRKDFDEDEYTMSYIWYLANIKSGQPTIVEKQTFDDLSYFSWDHLQQIKQDLSPNARNLVEAYTTREIKL